MTRPPLPRRVRRRLGRIIVREHAYRNLCDKTARNFGSAVLSEFGDRSRAELVAGANCLVICGASLVVRIARAWPFDPDRERRAWDAARLAGCPAPEYLGSGRRHGRPYIVYRRLPGERVTSESGMSAAAAVLARIHAADRDEFPRELSSRHRRLARFQIALDAASLIPRADRAFGRQLIAAAADDWSRCRLVAVHGDFRRPNILEGAGRITGVLDWSDCRTGSRESDLGGTDVADVPALVRAYQAAAARTVDHDLVAGYMLARCLALRACAVPGFETQVRQALLLARDGWGCP